MKLTFIICVTLLIHCTWAQDDSSPEERLRKDLFAKYNKDTLPPHNWTNPVKVELGFNLVSIQDLDVKQQKINVNGWLRFNWTDSRLRWDPKEYDGIEVVRVGVQYLWIPDVTLYNSADWPVKSTTQHGLIYPTGQVFYIPLSYMSAYCEVDFTYYPYDRHQCFLKFGSWVYDGFHLDLNVQQGKPNIDMSDMFDNNELKVVSTSAERSLKYYNCCKEPYPDVTFNMTLQRQSPVYQAAVLFPVIATVTMALFAFFTSPFKKHRIFINAFNIHVLLLTLIHLHLQVPVVGLHSPAIVLICETMILLLSLAIVWSIITTSFVDRCNDSAPPRMVRSLNNSWLAKVLLVSKGDKKEECCKKTSETNKDQEMASMVAEDKSVVTDGWMTFFSFLDRLAFVSFIVIVVALLVAFTR